MYPREYRLSIMGRLEEIARIRDFVTAIAQEVGMSDQAIHHCALAIDETCTNIIEHGYQFDGANKTIEIICQSSSDGLMIHIRDEGPAFNPLIRPDPDPTADLEERSEGGWGIFFTKKVMDEVQYFRDGNYNQLSLSKYFKAS